MTSSESNSPSDQHQLNSNSEAIIGTSIDIHRRLGPGLLESAYTAVLAHELRKQGLTVSTEVPLPVVWDSVRIDVGYRIDMLVNDTVIVELKSTESSSPVHKKHLLTYLRLTGKRLGLLINFNVEILKNGITRTVNGF